VVTDVLVRELADGVLRLKLNRPNQKNALNAALIAALSQSLVDASADASVRVVVVGGTGDAFCSGADLVEVEVASRESATFRGWLRAWSGAFRAAELCTKPVIGAVNGVAVAGGLELALACDVIVASDRARFCDAHIRYGLVPGGGGTQRLPAAIGTRWARWMMYTGETLDAASALAIGLVQRVIPAQEFDTEVEKLALTLASRSAVALSFMKHMTTSKLVSTELLDMEAEVAAHLVTGPDAREGLMAFKERRTPIFAPHASDWRDGPRMPESSTT
jgi:enoyl-CoA hydratase/carnithine racemase